MFKKHTLKSLLYKKDLLIKQRNQVIDSPSKTFFYWNIIFLESIDAQIDELDKLLNKKYLFYVQTYMQDRKTINKPIYLKIRELKYKQLDLHFKKKFWASPKWLIILPWVWSIMYSVWRKTLILEDDLEKLKRKLI